MAGGQPCFLDDRPVVTAHTCETNPATSREWVACSRPCAQPWAFHGLVSVKIHIVSSQCASRLRAAGRQRSWWAFCWPRRDSHSSRLSPCPRPLRACVQARTEGVEGEQEQALGGIGWRWPWRRAHLSLLMRVADDGGCDGDGGSRLASKSIIGNSIK